MPEGDVTINLPKLYRGVADWLKQSTKDSTYNEGWNDAPLPHPRHPRRAGADSA